MKTAQSPFTITETEIYTNEDCMHELQLLTQLQMSNNFIQTKIIHELLTQLQMLNI